MDVEDLVKSYFRLGFSNKEILCLLAHQHGVIISKRTLQRLCRKRSGYYGNLGSLKAGTRHHGDYSVMGNSFPPTFPEDLLAHASQ